MPQYVARKRNRDFDPLQLTRQQHRCLALLAEGLTNREIAAQMEISVETVKEYVGLLLLAMGASNRVQAAVWYLEVR